ncbi:dTDP-4-dehydrorhamnose 3,5-epimerase [Variovorax terrae]|uniref:dTDP-4-dehydrorhamnose 3,5-epimerase n=1 Tax=Variovorax terrae TaxID=2923278 RepID=A0A9X2AL26_9BURK|nr:dTDP-4-dehydrorhamnose 3,5-epimerase [Variovorax terrae]MCJ0762213.1 dTDP-4-dehydrorhamnose 3,5-epimerase [Variovorax terrae]
MRLETTDPSEVLLLTPQVHADERGDVVECFRADRFAAATGWRGHWAQVNESRSRQGVLRGIHFQHGGQQGKLVRAVRGRIWDVAVDLRPGSPTFGRWTAHELSEHNRQQLWIGPGFGHGFLALSDCTVIYQLTTPYVPDQEGAIRWDDPTLAIDWPLQGREPILSERDRQAGLLSIQ